MSQDKWTRFIKDIEGHKQVFLVGPLFGRTHILKGPTVYVDGGVCFHNRVDATQNYPMISVGDGDSSDVPLDVVLPQDKLYSDLAYVLRSLPTSIHHVELLGFLGGRRDHELINYGEVHHFLKGANTFTTARFDDVIVAFAGGNLSMVLNCDFSVVVFEPSTVTITGACQFPLERPTLLKPICSHGLSNRGFGQVVIDSLSPCFLFLG